MDTTETEQSRTKEVTAAVMEVKMKDSDSVRAVQEEAGGL